MLAAICLAQLGCGGQEGGSDQSSVFPLALHPVSTTVPAPSAALAQEEDGEEQEMETATFAGGCFWCTEAVFLEVNGVKSVESGYTGGRIEFPTYQQVCTGRTGHAEAIRIKYDPELVSYEVLLEIFFKTHDPTTLNR
ncbi:MAG: peptide-methionine (S)-S-oxide reductase MsrA, partial [Planctomycetales bacterium]|nr:peptide-methionine (S)-S-oxide reductase MsrA [Planctomycetales bacterium]